MGFRASTTFWEDEVKWLLGSLQGFYWLEGGEFWCQNMLVETIISVWPWGATIRASFCLPQKKGEELRCIFILEGPQAGG